MKTLEQIKQAIVGDGIESCWPDGRNVTRLLAFFPESEWDGLGYKRTDPAAPHVAIELSRESIIERMRGDVEFAFEKALGRRGISAEAMNGVVKTWLWVLDDSDFDHVPYRLYGLPLLKAVARKYGFPNEIGDDVGNEDKYRDSDWQ